jgi:hypothetical protein
VARARARARAPARAPARAGARAGARVGEELDAAAVDARHVDLAAHELDELLADGEAEAHPERVLDALVPDLREETEELRHVLLPWGAHRERITW